MSDAVESPVASVEPAAPPLSPAVGSFRFFSKSQLWQWSAEVAHMHGYPDAKEVTTELVLGHKHPDDIERIATTIQTLIASGRAFCSRHRIIDIHGHEHPVMVISHKMLDKDGTGLGSEGFYIDLTGTRDIDVEEVIDSRVAEAAASRAAIEQVKGMFMLVYGIDAETAFHLLTWRSQVTNTKLRTLAETILRQVRHDPEPPELRERLGHLLLTAHRHT